MRKLAVLTTLVAFAVIAPSAGAKIVVQKSIAGVTMGVTENDVVATLGQPPKVTTSTDKVTGQPVRELDYGNTNVSLTGGVVTFVATKSKKEKTANGVAVGTSEKSLKKKVKGLKCTGKGSNRSCTKGSFSPGKTVTLFGISKSKKVNVISIGIVVD